MASPFDRIGPYGNGDPLVRSHGNGEPIVRLFVVSDTHGDQSCLSAGHARTQDHPIHAVVHLGDMGADGWLDPVPGLGPLVAVAGNTDPAGRRLPAVKVFEAGGLRFVCVHGHLQHVKSSLSQLPVLAACCQADVVLYGHTHRYRWDWMQTPDGRAVLLINPGSAFGFGLGASVGVLLLNVQGRTLTGIRITGQTETALEIGSFSD